MSLDLDKTYLELDEDDALYGLERQNEQVAKSFSGASLVKVPASYKKIEQIVFVGLGASALTGAMVESVYGSGLKMPIIRLGAGDMPKFVSSKTLVVGVSYSGNTKQVNDALKEAKSKKARVLVVTGGGQLATWAKKNGVPCYKFDVEEVAVSPIYAAGLMFGGVLGMLKVAGALKVSKSQINKLTEAITEVVDSSESQIKVKDNPAKIVAKELEGRPLVIVAGGHLKGAALSMAHYVEELGAQSAQAFSVLEASKKTFDFIIDSDSYSKPFEVVVLGSKLYSKKEKTALEQLAVALEDRGVSVVDYNARGKSELDETGEVMQFGLFVAYYLALLNKRKV